MTEQIGRRVPRKEDRRLLAGHARFGADVQFPRMAHVRVVRSPVAHGTVSRIATEAARAQPGVIDVVTAEDLPADLRIPVRLHVEGTDPGERLQPVLASHTVRYVGEPLAVVAAEDAYLAEDAAELVELEIDELPARLDAGSGDDEVVADFGLGYGDVESAFAGAAHVARLEFSVQRHSGVPLEPRALTVDYVPATGGVEIFGATKVPGFNRRVLAQLLDVDESVIHLHAVDAGGGFGVRGEFYPEDFLVPWLARRLRRPVSWVEDRAEHLVAVNHSRQQRHRLEVAAAGDGTILGLRDDVWHDNGAYVRTHGVIVPELTLSMLPGPYRVPAYSGRVRVALTNKTPCGTYRAPGRFEGTAAREQLLDLVAAELGMDRVELRRRNLLTPGELPHTRAMHTLGTELVLDSGDYPRLLDRALDTVDELGWRELVARGRAQGRLLGLGLSLFLEKSGLGPHDTADVEITSTGRVRVHSGGTSLGQGIETVLAQIVADEFGVSVDRVDVVNGDTTLQPFGTGSWASRSTVVAGSAVRGAGRAVALRVRELGAEVLEAAPEDVELADGVVRVRGAATARALDLAEVWLAAQPGSPWLRDGEPAGLSARHRFAVDRMTYPYGAHVCVVEVDPGSGGVTVLRYLVAYEVGRAVNPALVEGQLRGGVAQGVGGALLEEFRYDESGQPQCTTFMDYLMPTASEVPAVEIVLCEDAPATTNPLGARGAGEGGLTGAGAAVASAVSDAIGRPAMTGLPLDPGSVLAALGTVTGPAAASADGIP
ncbi:xanthine dehydrogenase family protein molybdopterin-binding subunit [Prauserella muralis]|uniref:Xanthine dehydrogenase n=1 Tax=Prauserella muralis TaxID=588067 RepID=A0A2V4ATH8_9PSEU|nr:xanthine dehydrogenase family protein molybdopterin-binding subunit [Prauserella muralis]PXY24647.1 xanthine dehydrogenase [Prauserella muralis]TWE27665.1 xanthine dehydrogenase molybdenum binding subunit apoprotein [Prauserella muralis]